MRYERGTCPLCGREGSLNGSGRVRRHPQPALGMTSCPAWGMVPAEGIADPAVSERGECRRCSRRLAVDADGTVRRHRAFIRAPEWCAGSRQPPR